LVTVVLLVLLRLNIGWHFFSEGMSHYTDPEWTSAKVLKAAKGPWAPYFQSYLPEHQDLQTLAAAEDMKAVDAWLLKTADALAVEKQRFVDFYKFDEAQQAAAEKLLKLRQDQIQSWGPDNKEDLETYIHERKRLETQRAEPAAKDVPFKKQRIAAKQAELNAQTDGWLADLQAIRKGFLSELAGLRNDDQLSRGLPPQPPTSLSTPLHCARPWSPNW